jgi:1-deoxy-D-xylulose-5-phosphate synthase
MELGKSIVRAEGKDAVVIAYGSSVNEALAAAAILEQDGIKITVVDARFCKPLDVDMVRNIDCGNSSASV